MDGRTISLEGLVVYSLDTRKACLPLQAVSSPEA
jgi:hypothetical protein